MNTKNRILLTCLFFLGVVVLIIGGMKLLRPPTPRREATDPTAMDSTDSLAVIETQAEVTAPPTEQDTPDVTPGPTPTPTLGPSPTPDLYLYMVTPELPPALTEEEQNIQFNAIKKEISQRAQALYDTTRYRYGFEIENPTFKQIFPEAHMYAIHTNAGETGDVRTYTIMVSRHGIDYAMPRGFNQLMFDAGYTLNEETRDELAHALIVAGMPVEWVSQPVTCDSGKEIDITDKYWHYTYEIDCLVAYGNIGSVNVRFIAFDYYFKAGLLGWGNLLDDGWREFIKNIVTQRIEP